MGTSEKPYISDGRKRALEALERRFTVEISQQQQKNNKRAHETEGEEGPKKQSSSTSFPAHELKDPCTPISSSKKGHFAFFDHPHGVSEEEASGPTYIQLTQAIHDNLQGSGMKLSSRRDSTTNRIMHELLQNGDASQKYMQGSRSLKIDNRLLLDSFVQGRALSTGARVRAIQSHSKRSKRHMSMRQHRKHGSFNLSNEFDNFDLFKPMHDIWKDYMIQLLKGIGKGAQLAHCLLTADLHGAHLQVVECKVTTSIGASGIMIRETAETFGIISLDNKFRVVPKKGSVFIFQAGCWKVTLHGDKLSLRDGHP